MEDLLNNTQSLKGKKFIFFMVPPWDGVWTRQNHFSLRFAKAGAEVLYVETPRAVTSSIKKKQWKNIIRTKPLITKIEERLNVMQLPLQLPGSLNSDGIAKFNAKIAAKAIKNWLQKNGWQSYILWCRVPGSVFILDFLKPEKLVYDITDDYELYARNKKIKIKTIEREKSLASSANYVFITSEALKQKDSLSGINLSFIPNGVDYDLFSKADDNNLIVNEEITKMPKPVIGYVGLTSYWMDFELLQLLGNKYNGHVVMVGPVAAQVQDKVKKIKGIKWIDIVPQKELPHYIKGFDVCIMPHQVNELRKRANPLKIWEYLATGKPFVSVNLPALQPAKDFVYIANNHDEFIKSIDTVLAYKDSAELKEKRKEVAYNFSWDKLFKKVLQVLHY